MPDWFWYLIVMGALTVIAIWFVRDKLDGGGDWWNDSGPDPAPADFRKSKRRRIIDWWQRWP